MNNFICFFLLFLFVSKLNKFYFNSQPFMIKQCMKLESFISFWCIHKRTFKHVVCVSINSTHCVQACYICRIRDIHQMKSTSEMNVAFLVCHSIQITFNDTVRSRLPLFSAFLHFGTIGKKLKATWERQRTSMICRGKKRCFGAQCK